jgi:hypothetical protein
MTIVSTRGATGIELNEAEAASLFDGLPAARLRESGVHHVVVTGEVILAADRGLAALSFVRFLREATSVGVWVSWSGVIDSDLDAGQLYHLPPPSSDSAWRAGHEAGLCYYRIGPGFIQVSDRRPGTPPRQVVLDTRAQLDLFTRYLVPGPAADTGSDTDGAHRDLVLGRLLLRIGDHAVTLPHRLLCRPVPWTVF